VDKERLEYARYLAGYVGRLYPDAPPAQELAALAVEMAGEIERLREDDTFYRTRGQEHNDR
jgi:hypothetical protein